MISLVNPLTILAIDTSCDETAVAVTRGAEVLANCLYSQIELHSQYGGVVPNLARLEHEKKFASVLAEALETAGLTLEQIDAVAVTQGPGLAIALEVGITKAKELAQQLNIPLIGVNHMAGHLISALAGQELDVEFPVLGLLVSGGHSEFVEVSAINHYRKLGGTLDDACGEAFDKCARMLGLPYPGGPLVSALAEKYRGVLEVKFEKEQRAIVARGYKDGVIAYELPVPMAFSGDLNMSFSGLKTAVKQLINKLNNDSTKLDITQTGVESTLTEPVKGEVAVMFEAAAIRMMTLKLEQAVATGGFREVWLGGGVVASDYFRGEVTRICEDLKIRLRLPQNKKLMTDNAAMIGVAAGLTLSQLMQESGVAKIAELSVEIQLTNKIFLDASEFSLLDRDPILSL